MKRVDRLVTRLADDDRTLVHDPRGGRRLGVGAFVSCLVGFASICALIWADPGWLTTVAGAVLGGLVGRAGLARLRRAMSYRSGWLAGRQVMVSALSEALRRGMDVEDWLHGELERDVKMLMGSDPRFDQ